VTPELIKHTATLAQLSFDDAEVAALVPRFQAFLGFVDRMRAVPDDGACACEPCMQCRSATSDN